LVDHAAMGAPEVPLAIKQLIRNNFKNTIILCGGYDKERAELDLESGLGDLIAFGRPFINNPDLVRRLKNNWALSKELAADLFYTSDKKGYTDYLFFRVVEPVVTESKKVCSVPIKITNTLPNFFSLFHLWNQAVTRYANVTTYLKNFVTILFLILLTFTSQ
jgi:hypothetical protein